MQRRLFDEINNNPSLIFLVLTNLFPIFGVIFLNFDIGTILFLYWTESAIIGFFNLLKMALLRPNVSMVKMLGKGFAAVLFTIKKVFTMGFFMIHYGGFMLGHLFFLIAIFNSNAMVVLDFLGPLYYVETGAVVAFILLFISHGFSFAFNYLKKGEYKRAKMEKLMMQPYLRIIIMHLTIIIGAFGYFALNSHISILIVLIVLKIVSDVVLHLKERKKFSSAQ